MSRNPTGDYTLPLPPVISGETIEADWANQTLADMQQALTDSLSRTGQGNMQSELLVLDGAKAAPGLAFVNEAGTGFYRPDAGDLYLAVLGVDYMRWTDDNGVQIFDDPDWYDVIDANQLTDAVAGLQSQIDTNTANIATNVADIGSLDGRVDDLETNVTPDPINSPNFRSNGSIRHKLNPTATIDLNEFNRSYATNQGGLTIIFQSPPGAADPQLGNYYQVEGQVIITNGAGPGVVTVSGVTVNNTLGAPSTIAGAVTVMTYLMQWRNGSLNTTVIWSAD